KQEFEEADALVPAGLLDAEQHQVLLQSGGGDVPLAAPPIVGELLDRVLGVVVVPRYTVVAEERKELLSALGESRLITLGDLGCVARLRQSAEEAVYLLLVRVQVLAAEPVLIYRPDDRPEKFTESGRHRLQLVVVRRPEEVVVQVADQVNEALLLRARQRVVGGEEVRD